MKKIQETDNEKLFHQKILLRADFNVSMEKGKVKEAFKIKSLQKTLDYLLEKKCQVAIASHFGRPEGKIKPEFSLNLIKNEAEKILEHKMIFVSDCVGEEVVKSFEKIDNGGEVLLLENVRFQKEEEENEEKFAQKLAENFDIFVNDAFSVSHRNHASVAGVTKFIPSYAGFQLQKEIEEMEKLKNNFAHPAIAIIGGAKIETKVAVIDFFEKRYDFVLVGGKIANEALDQKMIFSEKVVLPTDFVGDRLDIGEKTIKKFEEIISCAQTIVWNGPLGKFEEEKYARGTYQILDFILKRLKDKKPYVVLGGGETLEILERRKAMEKISFVSTGGGAMLAYIGGEKMPGLESMI